MKEAYIYKDNKVTVADITENECVEVKYNYQDNIEEILKTENILEYLSSEKEKINETLDSIDKQIKTNEKTFPIIIASWFYYGFLSVGFGAIIGLFTNIWIVVWALPLLISIICTITAFYNEISTNILLNQQKGFKLVLQKIHEQLNKNKTYLEKLKKDKKTTQERLNEISKKFNYIDYKSKLEELKKYLETYKMIGENIELYKKYYKKGILEEKLSYKLEEEQIKLIKKYINQNKKVSN